MSVTAIIVAAGRGTRAGDGLPKQWRRIAGRRVIDWTLDAFRAAPGVDTVVVVLHPEDVERMSDPDVITAAGGATRGASVQAGLAAVPPNTTHVLIHDAARPCVPPGTIAAVMSALDTGPAAAPALAITDALWRGAEGRVTGTEERSGLFRAQTPQGFRLDAIRAAYAAAPDDLADDVAVARAAGLPVTIVAGDERNLKITNAGDFERAARLLERPMDIRLGNGFDVHRFGPGDHVTLCGVAVPHDRALQGHSDADVGMHAITDAIYGGLAQGDIGRHFPPSDPQWKGAASDIFLRHAVDLARDMGFRIGNADCTLVCELPKIGPHAGAMQAELARIMGIDAARVSVKATTSERLGFTGRGEGIAALATVTLVGG